MLGIIGQFLRSGKIYHLHLKCKLTLQIWSHLLKKSLTKKFIYFVHSGQKGFSEVEKVLKLASRKGSLQNVTTSPNNQPQHYINIADAYLSERFNGRGVIVICPFFKFQITLTLLMIFSEIVVFLVYTDIKKIKDGTKTVWKLSFFGLFLPLFGLNTVIYSINLRVQSKYRKMQTRKTPNADTFYSVQLVDISSQKKYLFSKHLR